MIETRKAAQSAAIFAMTLALALGGCATMQHARDRIVKRAPQCQDQTAQIYFDPQSAEVTQEGRAVLAAAAREAKGCKVAGIEVLGLADASGGADANLALSERRAQAVTTALAAAGLPPAEVRISAAGQAGATTAQGMAPLRRRADVVLHLKTP
jgi:outer membrane protein OmpA-like peptidoglycan-associated protein